MRNGRGRHADFAGNLAAVEARHAFVGQQLAPGGIGQYHQFGDEHVDGAAAFARFNMHSAGSRVENFTGGFVV